MRCMITGKDLAGCKYYIAYSESLEVHAGKALRRLNINSLLEEEQLESLAFISLSKSFLGIILYAALSLRCWR